MILKYKKKWKGIQGIRCKVINKKMFPLHTLGSAKFSINNMRRLFFIQYTSIVCQSLLNSSFFFNSVRVNPFLRHLFSLFQPAARRAGGAAQAGRGARGGRRARWPRPRLWPLPHRARTHHQQRRGVQVSFYDDAHGESRCCALFGRKQLYKGVEMEDVVMNSWWWTV